MNKEEIKKFVKSMKSHGGVIATKDPHYISILKQLLIEKTSITDDMINDIINFNTVDYFINFSNYDDLTQDNAVFNRLYII